MIAPFKIAEVLVPDFVRSEIWRSLLVMFAELNNAQIEYQRYEQLYKDGAISASERDSKYLTLATAKEQVAEAKANLNRIESAQDKQIAEAKATLNKIAEVRPVDIAVAEAEVRQAQATVRVSQSELDRAYIRPLA